MRWTLAATLLATLAAFSPHPAGAQSYPGCAAEFSEVAVDPGDTITITGTNAQPGEEVVASIEGDVIGRGTATDDGEFSFTASIPTNLAPGTYTVQVSCGALGAVISTTITVGPVTSPPGPPPGRLPKTGAGGTVPLTQIAIGLVAVGGLVALTSRRRSGTAGHPGPEREPEPVTGQ